MEYWSGRQALRDAPAGYLQDNLPLAQAATYAHHMKELWNAVPNIGWFYVGVVGMALVILIVGMITFTVGHFRRRREPEDQF